MSFSDWKLNANRVTTEEIKLSVSSLCAGLVLTRNIEKYEKFNKNTIDKMFAWGDTLANLVSKADKIQLSVVQNSMSNLGICLIDTNPGYLLLNPIEMILKVILSSPFLYMLKNYYEIIDESTNNSMKRLGEEKTITICQEILKNIIEFRLLMMKSSHLKQEIDICNEVVLPPNVLNSSNYTVMGSDEDYLSFELLYGIYHGTVIHPNSTVLEKVKISAMNDGYTFQLLCNSLTLSPASIIQSLNIKLTNIKTHGDLSHSNLKSSEGKSPDEIFTHVYNITNNADIWGVVIDVLRQKFEFINLISYAESNHGTQHSNDTPCALEVTIMYLMLHKNMIFLTALVDIMYDDAIIEKYRDVILILRQYCYKTGGEAYGKYKHFEEKCKLLHTNM